MTVGSDEFSQEQRILVPPCQDPPTRRHRLRTDKSCAQLTNIWGEASLKSRKWKCFYLLSK